MKPDTCTRLIRTIAAVSSLTTIALAAEIVGDIVLEHARIRARAERYDKGMLKEPTRFKPETFHVLPKGRE
jgi:hypothetical protein